MRALTGGSIAAGLNADGSQVKRMAGAEDGAPAPFIAVQPFPALLDLPLGSDAIKASCGSRHTAVVTRASHEDCNVLAVGCAKPGWTNASH
nr:RCC1 domain-containing protein 1-like isoform X1 [Saimiri boliviensis boliviensis]